MLEHLSSCLSAAFIFDHIFIEKNDILCKYFTEFIDVLKMRSIRLHSDSVSMLIHILLYLRLAVFCIIPILLSPAFPIQSVE